MNDDDINPIRLAYQINMKRRQVDGFVLAADALLQQAEVAKQELIDLEELWTVIHEADRELERPKRRKK